jgi:hypothetical protein
MSRYRPIRVGLSGLFYSLTLRNTSKRMAPFRRHRAVPEIISRMVSLRAAEHAGDCSLPLSWCDF